MRDRIRRWLGAWLVHPWLPLHLAVLAMLLALPALQVDWQFDDHFHRLVMLGAPQVETHPLEVFSGLRGKPELVRDYIDTGLFPWWTAPGFRFAFFRYLSAADMWLDYQLWPDLPALMHLHSLLWYAGLIAAATLLFRRLLGSSWCAGLAALLYAVDEAHVGAASWLANRNALLATLFGILSLWCYDRWRKGGSSTDAVSSTLCLALALCSGEMALATAGYLLAYAIFLDRGTWLRKLTALTPHVAVLLTWAAIYRALHFGTFGSGFYQDPLSRPAAFLGAVFSRAPVLLLGQWSPIPADLGVLAPETAFVGFWLAGVVVIGLGVVFLAPLVREDPLARFWALGLALSLIPISAVAPANRLLFFVGLGSMGLLAQFAHGVVENRGWVPAIRVWRRPARALLGLLAIIHLGVAPLASPLVAYSIKSFGEPVIRAVASVPHDPAIARQDLVLVNPPDYLFLVTPIGTLKMLEGKPYPRRMRALAGGTSPVEITRLDAHQLRVKTEEGLHGGVLGRLFRSRLDPMHRGDVFEVPGLTVEIVGTDSRGEATEFLYTFSAPLEDTSLRWLRWENDAYVPFDPPPIGESVALPPSYGPMDVFRRAAHEIEESR